MYINKPLNPCSVVSVVLAAEHSSVSTVPIWYCFHLVRRCSGDKNDKNKNLSRFLFSALPLVCMCVLCVCSRQVLRVVQLIRKRPYKCWPLMRNTNSKVMCKDSAQQESYKPYHSDGYNCTVDINTCGINRVCVCAHTPLGLAVILLWMHVQPSHLAKSFLASIYFCQCEICFGFFAARMSWSVVNGLFWCIDWRILFWQCVKLELIPAYLFGSVQAS